MDDKRQSCLFTRRIIIHYSLPIFFLLSTFNANSQTCERMKYRSIDGICNNIRSANAQNWGAAQLPFYREMIAEYSSDDIFNGMHDSNKPNARAISNELFDQEHDTGNSSNLSSFVFTWGQFIDHDITLVKDANNEAVPITLPPDEPLFTSDISFNRSGIYEGTGIFSSRDQENLITAWIDGSQIYGSDEIRANWLRTFENGRLKTSTNNLLPYNTLNGEKNGIIDPNAPNMGSLDNGQTTHFVAGDVRANEQPGLTALHILFVREHNRICEELVTNGIQEDEIIFQMARKKVGAIIQAITYEQFLPALGVHLNPYLGYNNLVQPDIMNIFATAAYRIGHTMVTSELLLLNDDCSMVRTPLSLEQAFFNSKWIETYGIAPILKGLSSQQQEEIDLKVIDGLRNFLFAIPQLSGTFGLDLAALNIQRGRDHGMPDYRRVRQYFMADNIATFTDINQDSTIAGQLATIYKNDISNIDLWVGLLAEDHIPNSNMGPTMHAILKKQFQRLRDGDYYFFQNDPFFSPAEKQNIKAIKLGEIIARNTNLNNFETNVFFTRPCIPALADCNAVELEVKEGQIEIQRLNAPFTSVKVFDKNGAWKIVASCSGSDCSETQVFDLPPSDYFVEIIFYERYWKDFVCKKEFEVSLEDTTTYDCEKVDFQVNGNTLEINNLTAPFNTVKVFDKKAGWDVVARCVGSDCNESTIFNLAEGEYFVQINAYEKPWQSLICTKASNITISITNNVVSCEDISILDRNGGFVVEGLKAGFNTVKVFDMNNGWTVVDQCLGKTCQENQFFIMPNGEFNVEITMYEKVWKNKVCRKYFRMSLKQNAIIRGSEENRNLEKSARKFKVFPNPSQDKINIDVQKFIGNSAYLELVNPFGQKVKSLRFDNLSTNIITFPVDDVTNGWYYLSLKIENQALINQKVIISRLY